MMRALREVRIQPESMGEAVISSFDAKSMIKKMAMIAPPTPRPIGMVIEMALDAAEVDATVVITVESIFPSVGMDFYHL